MKNKYRVGKKNKVAILLTETGEEHLIFPHARKENVQAYCNWLNEKHFLETSLNTICLVVGFMFGLMSGFILYCVEMFSHHH